MVGSIFKIALPFFLTRYIPFFKIRAKGSLAFERCEFMLSVAKRIFLIVCCLVLLSLGVISLFEQQFIRGIIKIVFAGLMLVIYLDRNIEI